MINKALDYCIPYNSNKGVRKAQRTLDYLTLASGLAMGAASVVDPELPKEVGVYTLAVPMAARALLDGVAGAVDGYKGKVEAYELSRFKPLNALAGSSAAGMGAAVAFTQILVGVVAGNVAGQVVQYIT